jgi:hypothetical protein
MSTLISAKEFNSAETTSAARRDAAQNSAAALATTPHHTTASRHTTATITSQHGRESLAHLTHAPAQQPTTTQPPSDQYAHGDPSTPPALEHCTLAPFQR